MLSFLISLGDDLTDSTEMPKDMFASTICSIALATMFRECLKLGNSSTDRLVIKELVKAVQDLCNSSWTEDENSIYCVGSFAYAIKKGYSLDKLTTRALEQISKPYKLNKTKILPESNSYMAHRLEFCNQAPGLAELFDSIVSNIDTSTISDAEEETVQKSTKTRKVTRRDVSSSEDECSDTNEASDEDIVVQKRPAFSSAPVPQRERISRSSKSLAQDKISMMADENVENQ